MERLCQQLSPKMLGRARLSHYSSVVVREQLGSCSSIIPNGRLSLTTEASKPVASCDPLRACSPLARGSGPRPDQQSTFAFATKKTTLEKIVSIFLSSSHSLSFTCPVFIPKDLLDGELIRAGEGTNSTIFYLIDSGLFVFRVCAA